MYKDGWLVGFYGILTFVGYFTPNSFLCIFDITFIIFQTINEYTVLLSKTFLFQAIQFIQTILIQLIQFSMSIDFVYI